MSAERIVALVGRRDEPTDGVADYCAWLGGAIGEFGYHLETISLGWPERGWRAALADLHELVGFVEVQRLEKYGIDDGEDGAVGADA